MIELVVAFAVGLGVGWMLNERARLDRDYWMLYALRLEKVTDKYFTIINKKQ